ncbi:MAG: hypothetical protein R3E32_16570 [Chitinophagales bacterium]
MEKSKVILTILAGLLMMFAESSLAQTPNQYQFIPPNASNNKPAESSQPSMQMGETPIPPSQDNGKQTVTIGPLQIELEAPPAVESTEIFEFMSQGQRPGIRVSIPSANAVDVAKSWKKYLKDFGAKPKMYGSEFLSKEAYIDGLSENTVDIYSMVQPHPEGTLLKVFFDLGEEKGYLASPTNAEKYEVGLAMIRDFAITESYKAVSEELETEEKTLYQMDKARQKLQAEYDQLVKDIENYKQAINKAETDIEQNSLIQEDRNKMTHEQIQKVEQLKYNLHSIRSQQ